MINIKKIISTAMAAVLLTGCAAESERTPVNAELHDLIIPIEERSVSGSSSETSTEEPAPAESSVSGSSSTAISAGTTSSSGANTSSTRSSSTSARSPSSKPQASPETKPENGTVMYVTRQKYGKKAPCPDAERSLFYAATQKVVVVEKTNTGYYKLDNGDYINCDYVAFDPSADPTERVNVIPSEVPAKTSGKNSSYDPTAALKYAAEHWDKDESLCAEFASECLTAGGLKYDLASSTSLYNAICASGLGYSVKVGLNEDGTATAPEYVKAGDIIFYYCAAENMTVHTAVCNGKTKDGLLKAFAHNTRDSGEDALVYKELCTGGCGYPLTEIFVFCFY